jgi:NAD(P)-dependent dehydrogenase (short-subunit alcohol dehydrogenase family)
MGKLKGKVAIVPGSGRGIGREIGGKLASEDAAVVANDLDESPAKQTVAGIEAVGGTAVGYAGSVTEHDFAERFVHAAVDTFGGLDIIVNNTGYTWDTVQPVISAAVKRATAAGEAVPGAVDAAKANRWSTEMQGRVVDACVQLHGGYGYMTEYPIARAWLDSRVSRTYAGTTEIMKEIIGRSLELGSATAAGER